MLTALGRLFSTAKKAIGVIVRSKTYIAGGALILKGLGGVIGTGGNITNIVDLANFLHDISNNPDVTTIFTGLGMVGIKHAITKTSDEPAAGGAPAAPVS